MPRHTTAGEDAVYESSDVEVQAIIDRLDTMIEERDTEIASLKTELADVKNETSDQIAGLKEEIRNQSEYHNP